MAYNRDWDQGKDSWGENNSWGGSDRGNIRGREDDYYGEGKRRKFNNGGYGADQSYDDSNYDTGSGQGKHNDHFQDYSHDDRGQKGFQSKKRLVPSEPSPHVIFLGLDPDFSEADLQAYLSNNGCNIETVTIIRDRSTGTCPFGFGFAQFPTVEHARAFVDPLFPFIQVPPPASHGASASATFYKALETGIPHNGRRVKIDYSQSATPHEKSRQRQNLNDGTRDIGNAQVPVLLFRGLDPLSGPQAIAQAMINSAGFGKQGAKGMKRIVLIKDKVTMASFGFAFVEFIDVQSASAVLANSMSSQIHPSGFRISDRPVAASFAHPYSFQPVADYMLRDETAIPSSMHLGGVENTFVKYWDESATVAVLEFKVEEPVQPQTQSMSEPTKDKKEKKKAKDDTIKKPPAPSILPISDKPVTLNFNKGGPTNTKSLVSLTGPKAPPAMTLGFSAEDFAADDDVDEQSTADDSKAITVKKVAPLITSKKVVNNIQKWNQVQEELKEDSTKHLPALIAPALTSAISSTAATPDPPEAEFEFSDTAAMTCLLCARQFKSTDQLKRHNKESELHKKNFKDTNLREIARQKANTAKQTTASSKAVDQPKYRDRASERRIMHNQPDIPLPEKDTTSSAKKKRQADGPPPPPSPPPPAVIPSQDATNVGNKMLKMMGWKEGSGLGSSGDGRVDPIQTAIYTQGVGLGASKGKEIGKYAEGYTGYVHMAQDAARERYGS
ncbi:hypothetical protein BJ138DRAFT_1229047 [Hygrophoropsis aurantiaca]|uniref:Uncharacterized protein n=1 Tax=Hygrophoropsis aurantiaca TaxID=72124 RepID=A0ACB8ARX6_9AGAM|nr:hypothetical protein BJ138DRAFT_1229047 [Hygrophoropsis aurantiaca]